MTEQAYQSKVATDLTLKDENIKVYSLKKLDKLAGNKISRLPYSIRILVENLVRNVNGHEVKEQDVINNERRV